MEFTEAIALNAKQTAIAQSHKRGPYLYKHLVITQAAEVEWAESEDGGGVFVPASSIIVTDPEKLREFLNKHFPVSPKHENEK